MMRSSWSWLACCLALASATAQDTVRPARHVLAGRVRTADRDGVSGAKVVVRWRVAPELPSIVGWSLPADEPGGVAHLEVTADARGNWRVELPVKGPVELTAMSADGREQAIRRFPVMAGGFVEQIVEPAFRVQGLVHDAAGQPVDDFPLRFEPHKTTWTRLAVYGMPMLRLRAETDDDGRFSLPFPSAYTRHPVWEPYLEVRPFDGDWRFESSPLLRPTNECAELDLALERTNVISGSVRDVKGKGIAGARVYHWNEPWRSVRTDKNGNYSIPAYRASYLAAEAPGFSPAKLVVAPVAMKADEHRIELWPARRMSGRLLGSEGRPLGECEVLWAFQFGDEPPIERVARTDADGRFALVDAPLEMTIMGFVKVDGIWCRFLRTKAKQNIDLGDVPLSVRPLAGMVTNVEGAPVPHVRVVASCQDGVGDDSTCLWVTYTDHGGRYRFPALPKQRISVRCEAGAEGFTWAWAQPEEQTKNLQTKADGIFEVVALDKDEEPVRGAFVILRAVAGLRGDPMVHSPTFRTVSIAAIAGDDGRIRFRGLPPAKWEMFGHSLRDGDLLSGHGKGVTGDTDMVIRLR